MNSTCCSTNQALTKSSLNYPLSNRLPQRNIGQRLRTGTHASLGKSCSWRLHKRSLQIITAQVAQDRSQPRADNATPSLRPSSLNNRCFGRSLI
jgi:hypothetical protein